MGIILTRKSSDLEPRITQISRMKPEMARDHPRHLRNPRLNIWGNLTRSQRVFGFKESGFGRRKRLCIVIFFKAI
jgi:hypothetical protein